MLFLSGTFLCGDIMSLACTPTNLTNITDVKLSNCQADDLYVSNDGELAVSTTVPEWGWDTIFYAPFNKSTFAGNTTWTAGAVDAILVKRKKTTETLWTTILSKTIETRDDFQLSGQDITPTNGSYEYAVTCVIDGSETEYYYAPTLSISIDGLVIADKDQTWVTYLTDGFCDTTNVTPSQVVETMYSKYPTIVSNAMTNYQTISVSGNWAPYDCDTLGVNALLDDSLRVPRIQNFIAFLTNGNTKVLKNVDGREWLVYVTTPPTDAAQDYYKIRQISFECTEVGDVNGEEELYNAGIIDTDPIYWSYSV